jgi:hypothetical protein
MVRVLSVGGVRLRPFIVDSLSPGEDFEVLVRIVWCVVI